MANVTAQRCYTRHAISGPPLVQNGHLTLQTHDIGWIVAGIFTVSATLISFWLIGMHLKWYTKERQQRYIIRLLLMVPIYAVVSLASYIFWNHAIPITLYLSPTTEGQKEVFRSIVFQKWVFPLGFVKYRPKDGLYFLQLMKWGVLQYCVVRPTTTLAAVILDFIGLYCSDSWSPGWGHIYITIIVSLSVTVAMYCLFQLYIPISVHLASHKPLLKLFSVKAVVFLTFWQASGLSLLSMFGVIKDTTYMTADDINTGISAILETFEMTCFAILHIRAFSYKPYCTDGQKLSHPTPRLRSFMHALDIRDMWREIREGSVYMGKTIRGVEAEEGARRRTHFAKVMGRERELIEEMEGTKESWPIEDYLCDEDLLLDIRRQEGHVGQVTWLNATGNKLGIALDDDDQRKCRRPESAGEYKALFNPAIEDSSHGHPRENKSWWNDIYTRLSQDGPDRALEERYSSIPQRPSQKRRRNRQSRQHPTRVPSLDSPPPQPCVMFEYSGLGDGPSRMRLFPSHRPEKTAANPKEPPDSCSSPYPSLCPSHSGTHDETVVVQLGGPIALQLPSASQIRHIERHVSSGQTQLSPASRNDYSSSHLASLGMTRSDSIPARFSPTSTSPTFDGQVSFGGGTTTATHFSPIPYHASLPRIPPEHVSSQRPCGRGPQKQYSPIRGHQRPRIVLPIPLSPTHYMVTEAQPHVPAQLLPVEFFPQRSSRGVGRQASPLRDTCRFATPVDGRLGHSAQLKPERPVIARQHTDFVQPALVREPQTMDHTLTPMTANLANSPMVENGGMGPAPNVEPSLSSPSASSAENRTALMTMPPLSSSVPPRQLRHPRGDVGVARRPWS